MKNNNYFIILILCFTAFSVSNCKSRSANGISQRNEYFKEILDPVSFNKRGEKRLYYVVMHIKGNKIEGIVDSNSNCLYEKNPRLFKTDYAQLHDSIFFNVAIYHSPGLKQIDQYKGIVKNDSMVLKKFSKSLLGNDYSYVKTVTYIKCR